MQRVIWEILVYIRVYRCRCRKCRYSNTCIIWVIKPWIAKLKPLSTYDTKRDRTYGRSKLDGFDSAIANGKSNQWFDCNRLATYWLKQPIALQVLHPGKSSSLGHSRNFRRFYTPKGWTCYPFLQIVGVSGESTPVDGVQPTITWICKWRYELLNTDGAVANSW